MEDSSGEDATGPNDFLNQFIRLDLSTDGGMNMQIFTPNIQLRNRNNTNRQLPRLLQHITGSSMPRILSIGNMTTQSSLRNVLQQSMDDIGGTKQVASNEILETIDGLPEVTGISDDEECPICMDGYSDKSGVQVKCGHIFHRKCIKEWLEGDYRCPVCRHEYPHKEVSLVAPDVSNSNSEREETYTPYAEDNLETNEGDGENDTVETNEGDGENDTVETNEGDSENDMIPASSREDMVGINVTIRTLGNMIRSSSLNIHEGQLNEERMLQQALFESLREPAPYDISGLNNDTD